MIFYILQVSTTKPTQYRVSVVQGVVTTPAEIHAIKDSDPDFRLIGIYDTGERLLTTLEPYLRMEDGA